MLIMPGSGQYNFFEPLPKTSSCNMITGHVLKHAMMNNPAACEKMDDRDIVIIF
jgi:hypothetical protein